jgi:hypothetical protein
MKRILLPNFRIVWIGSKLIATSEIVHIYIIINVKVNVQIDKNNTKTQRDNKGYNMDTIHSFLKLAKFFPHSNSP